MTSWVEAQQRSKVMRELPVKRCPRLATPYCFYAGKFMGSLLILNMRLCWMGVRVEGDRDRVSLRWSMPFAFHQVVKICRNIHFNSGNAAKHK